MRRKTTKEDIAVIKKRTMLTSMKIYNRLKLYWNWYYIANWKRLFDIIKKVMNYFKEILLISHIKKVTNYLYIYLILLTFKKTRKRRYHELTLSERKLWAILPLYLKHCTEWRRQICYRFPQMKWCLSKPPAESTVTTKPWRTWPFL